MTSIARLTLTLILAATTSPMRAEEQPKAAPKTLRVYHVGNSLTMSLRLERLHQLFKERGIDYQFGSQLSAAKSLQRHWNYKNEPKMKWGSWETNEPDGSGWKPGTQYNDPRPKRFGLYDQALAENTWDAVVLQPYGSSLRDDLEACGNFIELARKKSPDARFYIYSTWPKRKSTNASDDAGAPARNIDYAAAWTAKYTYGPDSADRVAFTNCASRDYYEKLLRHLSSKFPDLPHPISLIPGGEVLFALDEAIREEKLPELKELYERSPKHLPGMNDETTPADGANILYADAGHLNPMPHEFPTLGVFAVSMTMFSTLSGQSPVGLSGATYDLDGKKDADLIRAVQELVWKVVTTTPLTGVHP